MNPGMLSGEVTNATPIGMAFVAVMMVLTLVLQRKWAFLPLLLTACWMTLGQKVVLLGINLPSLRLVILAILARLVLRGEYRQISWTLLDRILLLSLLTNFVAYVLLWQTSDAVINRLGLLFNGIGMYFGLRSWIRDREDAVRVIQTLVLVLLPVSIMMLIEKITGRNWFYLLGGVPEWTVIRRGAVRCQGPFSHPILAGTVGAVWFPVFWGLYWIGRGKFLAVMGMTASLIMTVTSASSGPLFALLTAVVAVGMWPIRWKMKQFRWGVVIVMMALQIVMSAPIWYVIARVNILSASTGWHRAHLIDTAVRRFPEWFLLGTKDVAAWGIFAGDVTNHYLIEGFRGGFITMVLFIWTMVLAYRYVGQALRGYREVAPQGRESRLYWTLGAAIAAHMMTFLSVAYWEGQSMLNWYLTLTLIVAVHLAMSREKVREAVETDFDMSRERQRAGMWWHETHSAGAVAAVVPAKRAWDWGREAFQVPNDDSATAGSRMNGGAAGYVSKGFRQ